MAFSLEVTRRFEKDFRKLPFDIRRRVDAEARGLENDPFLGKRLRGEFEGSHSLRIGDYRLIYRVIMSEKRVILMIVAHRHKVYG